MASVKATKTGSGMFSKQHAKAQHLLTHGISGEVADLRRDVAATLAPQAAITVDEFTTPPAGATLQLSQHPVQRAGGLLVLHEVVDGLALVPPTGTINLAGVYTPAAAPNGAHSYAVWYEFDARTIPNA
jgi:hypothetical protein